MVMIFFHLADSLASMVVNWAGVPPTGAGCPAACQCPSQGSVPTVKVSCLSARSCSSCLRRMSSSVRLIFVPVWGFLFKLSRCMFLSRAVWILRLAAVDVVAAGGVRVALVLVEDVDEQVEVVRRGL